METIKKFCGNKALAIPTIKNPFGLETYLHPK